MGRSPEVKLVIKHTFLEYVGDNKASSDHSLKRQRSYTEPAIFANLDYEEIRELIHGSDSSSSSSHQDDFDAWQIEPSHADHISIAPLSTPEVTPLLCPMARHIPGWLQEDWAEGLLPEALCASQQVLDDYCQWNEQYAMCEWWAPYYEQFQAEFSAEDQVYKSMVMNQDVAVNKQLVSANDGGKETRTSVMLRDLPEAYSRSSLLKLLDAEGFFGRFDFVYLPVDFKHQRNLGYALVNLVSPTEALRLTAHFEGFCNWGIETDNICSVGWCYPQQGLEAYVERYRNSPVMHESVPDEWRPMLLSHGVPIPFPAPTQKVKPPKVKGRQSDRQM